MRSRSERTSGWVVVKMTGISFSIVCGGQNDVIYEKNSQGWDETVYKKELGRD